MCKFSSKSGGVPFQISFFLGDLTRNDPYVIPLTHLINLSIVQGDFPNELKLAKVLPIYKSEEEHFTQNYRPISVLPYFSKKI